MAQSHILQVVNGDGEFNETGVEDFIRRHSISDAGVGYQVVAITGPQSSGKSTLMNAVVSVNRRHTYFSNPVLPMCVARGQKVQPLTQLLSSSPQDV